MTDETKAQEIGPLSAAPLISYPKPHAPLPLDNVGIQKS